MVPKASTHPGSSRARAQCHAGPLGPDPGPGISQHIDPCIADVYLELLLKVPGHPVFFGHLRHIPLKT